VIHFTDVDGIYQDYLKFAGNGLNSDGESDSTDIFEGEDATKYLPEAIVPAVWEIFEGKGE
jgi:hypothetical protein